MSETWHGKGNNKDDKDWDGLDLSERWNHKTHVGKWTPSTEPLGKIVCSGNRGPTSDVGKEFTVTKSSFTEDLRNQGFQPSEEYQPSKDSERVVFHITEGCDKREAFDIEPWQ